MRPFQKLALACGLFVLWAGVNTQAGEPLVVVKGGLSPDRRYAVAVVPSKPGEFLDEADTRVFLLDGQTRHKIGPLEEVDAAGGLAAGSVTTRNVRAAWSPDGHYLAINYSTGRSEDCQLYRLAERRPFRSSCLGRKPIPRAKCSPCSMPRHTVEESSGGRRTGRWLN